MICHEIEVWVLMDKTRKIIAKGVPRDRHLIFLDDPKDSKRIITYTSQKRAEAVASGFYIKENVRPHLREIYGETRQPKMDAVKAKIIIEIED